MKNLLSLTTVNTALLFSTLAFGDVQVFRGNLKQELSLNTSAIMLSEAYSNITILVKPNADSISVSLNLVGESDDSVDSYLRSWELKASGTSVVNLSVSPSGGGASNSCSKNVINGRYLKLQGVCVEGLVVTVPNNMKPKISSDKKMVTMFEKAPTTVQSGTIIPSKSVNQLINDLDDATFESDKEEVLQSFIQLQKQAGSNRRLLVNDLIKVLDLMSFDNGKMVVLRALLPFITNRLEAYQAVEGMLSFSSSKEEAREILLK